MSHERDTYKVDDLVLVESVFSEKSQESLKSLFIYKRQVRETFHDFSHFIRLDLMINVKKCAYSLILHLEVFGLQKSGDLEDNSPCLLLRETQIFCQELIRLIKLLF